MLKQFSTKVKKYLLIFVGTFTWSITMIKSGWNYTSLGINGSGLGFWGANGHDGIWHISLIESLSRGNIAMPIFAGERLQNYHIGFDLILAILHKITQIPVVNLYFQIIPIVLAIFIGILVYQFVIEWTKSEKSAFWATFFAYFGGSFGWVIKGSESTFWSQQGISTLINPPFALSLIFILLGLISLQKNNKLLAVLFFGILIQIKAYAGVLVLGALLVSGNFYVFFGSLLISVLIFLPFNSSPQSIIEWRPFWFLESMMGLVDRVNFTKFYSAMLTYKSGHVWGKVVLAYGAAFLIFILGNLGTRIIFIFRKIKLDAVSVFIYSIILAGILIPTFFVQKGTPWNTIQFFYYSLFFTSILAGIVMAGLKQKWLLICIVLLTIPTTLITLKSVYLPGRPPAMIGTDELMALRFLSKLPDGIVLTKPFDDFASKNAQSNPPRPLYLYTSTAYVSAFSKHQTFMEDEINLDITGYDWQKRRSAILDWYSEPDFDIARKFLLSNNIKYIYWIKEGQSPLDLTRLGIQNVYENDLVTIYKVD